MYYLLFMTAFFIQKPTIELTVGGAWLDLEPTMYRSTDGSPADYPTLIRLRADETFLHVSFDCEKDTYVGQNCLHRHNEPLYNQEVFEVFIAAGEANPVHYLEFEINPNDATWIGKISNKGTEGISVEMVEHAESGVRHSTKKAEGTWSGEIAIPWRLVSDKMEEHYRLNFYRIVSKKSNPEPDWVCNADNAEFLCWSATFSGTTPNFHLPEKFGHLMLK